MTKRPIKIRNEIIFAMRRTQERANDKASSLLLARTIV